MISLRARDRRKSFLFLLTLLPSVASGDVKIDGITPSKALFALSDGVASAMRLAAAKAGESVLQGDGFGLETQVTEGSGASALNALCDTTVGGNGTYGIAGPLTSEESGLLGAVVSDYSRLSIVSYGALFGAAVAKLPYLFSVQPSGDLQMQAVVKLVLEMKVARDAAAVAAGTSYISSPTEKVVLIYSATSYGEGAALAFLQAASDLGLGSEPVPLAAVTVSQSIIFSPDDSSEWENMLALIGGGSSRIIILLAEGLGGVVQKLLSAADAAGMLSSNYQWILGGDAAYDGAFAANASYVDMELAYAARGSLGVRPCAPKDSASAEEFATEWAALDPAEYPGAGPTGFRSDGTVEPLYRLAYDTVMALALALAAAADDVGGTGDGEFPLQPYDLANTQGCLFGDAWALGEAVRDALAKVSFEGASGNVVFGTDGTAASNAKGGPSLCVVNLQPDPVSGAAWVELYGWAPSDGLGEPFVRRLPSFYAQTYPGGAATYPSDAPSVSGLHLRILTKPASPFMFIDGDNKTGYTYYGISERVTDELSTLLNFTYEFVTVPNITANELVAAVAAGEYDFGISAVTISVARWQNVSFTYPYYDLGLAFVYKTPEVADPSLFRMFKPFTLDLWMAVMASTLCVALLFWLFEGVVNDDFTHMPYSTAQSFGKTIYVTLALLFQQLTHKPETPEGYIVTTGFMAFAFIVAASYTAELASYLTIQKAKTFTVNAAAITAGKIPLSQVGIPTGTSTELSFQRDILGCDPPASACSAENAGYVSCSSFDDCFQSILNGTILVTVADYPVAAYSALNDYCGLTVDTKLFDLQNYGVVLPLGSPYLDQMSLGMLTLREDGTIDSVSNAYIGSATGKCASASTTDSATSNMGLQELGGIFVILGMFMALAMLTFFCRTSRVGKRFRHKLLGLPPPPRAPDDKSLGFGFSAVHIGGGGGTAASTPYHGMSRSARKRKLFEALMEAYIEDQAMRQRTEEEERRRAATLEIERGAPRVSISGIPTDEQERREEKERESRATSLFSDRYLADLFGRNSASRRGHRDHDSAYSPNRGEGPVVSPLHDGLRAPASAAAAEEMKTATPPLENA